MDFNNAILNIRYNDEWLQLPAIKGTSACITSDSISREVDGRTQTGHLVTLTNDGPQASVSTFEVWDGLNGTGRVEKVDGVEPASSSTDIQLKAIRYVSQPSLSTEDRDIARNNIHALSTGLTINSVSINNASSSTPTIQLTPANIGAIHSGLKINGKSITNSTQASASITLIPTDISAVHSGLTINKKSITNPTQASASITLVPADISAVHSGLKINGKSITNPTQDNASITLTASDLIDVVPTTRTIDDFPLTSDITTRVIFKNVAVLTEDWSSNSTYEAAGYGYRGSINLPSVTSSMVPNVIFNIDDSLSGNFAPIAEAVPSYVYIYAGSIPDTNITIPTIICFK